MPPHTASTHGSAAQPSLLLAITNVVIVVSSTVVSGHRGQQQPSSLSSASSISLPPPLPCYCHAFLLLLPPFSVADASFSVSSPSPHPSSCSSYLNCILFDWCVLLAVFIVRCHVVSLLLLKILDSASATLLSPRHRLLTLSALALSSI